MIMRSGGLMLGMCHSTNESLIFLVHSLINFVILSCPFLSLDSIIPRMKIVDTVTILLAEKIVICPQSCTMVVRISSIHDGYLSQKILLIVFWCMFQKNAMGVFISKTVITVGI